MRKTFAAVLAAVVVCCAALTGCTRGTARVLLEMENPSMPAHCLDAWAEEITTASSADDAVAAKMRAAQCAAARGEGN